MAFKKIYKEKMKLRVEGSMLKLSNLVLTEGQKSTRLTADVSAAGTTLTVANFTGIADNDYLLVGVWGEPTAEIVQVDDGSVDATVTVGALVHDHFTDTPVTVIPCNHVEFYRETTLIAAPNTTNPTNQVGSDVDIMAYRKETIISDGTNTTGYAYARFGSTEDTKYSEFTLGVIYEGNAYNSIDEIVKSACGIVGIGVGEEHAEEEQLMRDCNEAQNIIVKKEDWIFELIKNETSISTTENEYKYALSGLTLPMKYPNSKQGVLNVHFGNKILNYKDNDQFDEIMEDTTHTELAADSAAAAVTVTLDDSYEFAESGTVYIGSNTITYTTNTETTGVLSGVPASGTGSIVTAVSENDTVWQNLSPGVPENYTIFNGNIYVDRPIETDEVGKKLKFKYLKQLTRFDDFSDTSEIPFYEAIEKYIEYKVEKRRGNKEEAAIAKTEFDEIVNINMEIYRLPTLEETEYYNFGFESTNAYRNEEYNE